MEEPLRLPQAGVVVLGASARERMTTVVSSGLVGRGKEARGGRRPIGRVRAWGGRAGERVVFGKGGPEVTRTLRRPPTRHPSFHPTPPEKGGLGEVERRRRRRMAPARVSMGRHVELGGLVEKSQGGENVLRRDRTGRESGFEEVGPDPM